MNRYTAHGIVADVMNGKRIAIIGDAVLVRQAFEQIIAVPHPHHLDRSFRVGHALGREYVQHLRSHGSITFGHVRRQLRGFTFDTVYVEGPRFRDVDDLPDLATLAPEVIYG